MKEAKKEVKKEFLGQEEWDQDLDEDQDLKDEKKWCNDMLLLIKLSASTSSAVHHRSANHEVLARL